MAGSFRHVVDKDLKFRGCESLDHLGDASEALQEFYDMVMYLSGGDKEKLYDAWRNGHIVKRYTRAGSAGLMGVRGIDSFWED